jgi:prefoldin beta subunit
MPYKQGKMLKALIIIEDNVEEIEKLFSFEDKNLSNGRAQYELCKVGKNLEINVSAKDSVALRSILTSITRVLTIDEKINNLSMLEQNAQQLSTQRQSFQSQILEIDSALEELKNSKEAYRIIGSIMVKSDASKLKEELDSKKKLIDIRVNSIEKQEEIAREKAKKLQEEIMNELENSKKSESNKSPAKNKKE